MRPMEGMRVIALEHAVAAPLCTSSFHFKRTHSSRTADGILCGLVMVPTGEGE